MSIFNSAFFMTTSTLSTVSDDSLTTSKNQLPLYIDIRDTLVMAAKRGLFSLLFMAQLLNRLTRWFRPNFIYSLYWVQTHALTIHEEVKKLQHFLIKLHGEETGERVAVMNLFSGKKFRDANGRPMTTRIKRDYKR